MLLLTERPITNCQRMNDVFRQLESCVGHLVLTFNTEQIKYWIGDGAYLVAVVYVHHHVDCATGFRQSIMSKVKRHLCLSAL